MISECTVSQDSSTSSAGVKRVCTLSGETSVFVYLLAFRFVYMEKEGGCDPVEQNPKCWKSKQWLQDVMWFRGTIEKGFVQNPVQLKAGVCVLDANEKHSSFPGIKLSSYAFLPHAQLLPLSSGKGSFLLKDWDLYFPPALSTLSYFKIVMQQSAIVCLLDMNMNLEEQSWPWNLILILCFLDVCFPLTALTLNFKPYLPKCLSWCCRDPTRVWGFSNGNERQQFCF